VTRVVFVPSSTRVMVSPPDFVTVTVGAGAAGAAGVAAGTGVDEAVVGAGVAGAAAVLAGAGVGVAGGAAVLAGAGAGVAGAAAVAAGALVVVVRAGGGVGSAAAVPAGLAAVPPARLCMSCGRSLSASVRWLRAASGLPAVMSVIPPSMSPTAFMLPGRMLLAASLTSFPGSVTTALMSETMLPRLRPMTFSLWLLG
jgi:hypothetical protein